MALVIEIKELYILHDKTGRGEITIKVCSMNAAMDLSFPGQRTATATSCIPHNSVYMPGHLAGKSESGFFRCDA